MKRVEYTILLATWCSTERDDICHTIVYKSNAYQADIAVHIITFTQRLVISGLIIHHIIAKQTQGITHAKTSTVCISYFLLSYLPARTKTSRGSPNWSLSDKGVIDKPSATFREA